VIYDVTVPLARSTAHWPGDRACDYRLSWSQADGARVNVGWLSTSVHNGTHVDAPFHFDRHGATVDMRARNGGSPLGCCCGPGPGGTTRGFRR
jgi:arylformamidase